MKQRDTIEIVVDMHEPTEVVGWLEELSTDDCTVIVRRDTLEIGDYVVSPDIAFERKEFKDFLHSMFDENEQHEKRYGMRQIADLAREYRKPGLILEGGELKELYMLRSGIPPNSIRGTLHAIAFGFRVPILPTFNLRDTAAMLVIAAKKAQLERHAGKPTPHGKRSHLSLDEKQVYLITAIMGIGVDTAIRLLGHFKTPQAIVNATESELMAVHLVGKKTAATIHEIVATDYKP